MAVENKEIVDSKGTACIGCRLRRKRCDKKHPICTGCSDLQIPRELCIYRKMGLASKDSKATLAKEVKKNRELKDDKERTMALYNYNKRTSGSPQDYFYLKDTRREGAYKMFQLNPEKNPLLCTVMTAPQTSAYLGSISVAAITEAEPQMKLLLQQIHRVIMKEKIIYEKRVAEEAKYPEKEIVVATFNEHCRAFLVGIKDIDGDQSILELIGDIEQNFPSQQTCEYALQLFFRQNSHRWTMFPYVDEASFREKFDQIVKFDQQGRVSFHIALPQQSERIVFIAWVLAILALASFCFGQSRNDVEKMDFVLFAKYSSALTRVDIVGKRIRLGEQAIGFEFIAVNFALLLLEKYTASAGFMDSLDKICEATLSIRLLITMAMSTNLHKDPDRFYPNATAGEKRSLKTLWYTLVMYETFESMDIGFIPKFEPACFRRDDSCYNGLIECLHTLHSVLFNYNMIDDMGKVDDLIEFLEGNLIKRLKRVLKDEFKPMAVDIEVLQNYDLDDISIEHLEEYHMIMQRLGMRYLILTTILAFYHICYKRLEQTGEGQSQKCRRFRMLGWKYALTIETLFGEMWVGLKRAGNHKNYFSFFPVACILVMAPILRFAQRRVTLFATSRFLGMLNVDDQLIVNYVLYGNDQQDDATSKLLEASGEVNKMFKIGDFDDLDVDDDYELLLKKFGELNSVRFLVVSLCKVMSDTLACMHSAKTTFNFMKLSKIFHVLLLRLCSFLLNYTVQDSDNSGPEDYEQNGVVRVNKGEGTPTIDTGSPHAMNTEEKKFDFKSFFTNGHDVTVDEDEIFELFNMTSKTKYTW